MLSSNDNRAAFMEFYVLSLDDEWPVIYFVANW